MDALSTWNKISDDIRRGIEDGSVSYINRSYNRNTQPIFELGGSKSYFVAGPSTLTIEIGLGAKRGFQPEEMEEVIP